MRLSQTKKIEIIRHVEQSTTCVNKTFREFTNPVSTTGTMSILMLVIMVWLKDQSQKSHFEIKSLNLENKSLPNWYWIIRRKLRAK